MTSLNSLWTLFIAILAILNFFTIFEQKRVEKQFSSRTDPHSCPRLLLYKSRLLQEVTGKVYARAVTWVERPVPRGCSLGCSLGCSPCFSWVPVAVNVWWLTSNDEGITITIAIMHGNYSATSCVCGNFLRFWQLRAIFERNIGLEQVSSVKNSMIFNEKLTHNLSVDNVLRAFCDLYIISYRIIA